jgi:hypothetical protein
MSPSERKKNEQFDSRKLCEQWGKKLNEWASMTFNTLRELEITIRT